MKTIAVIGASANRSKYGNKAVRAYRQQGYAVYPVHPHAPVIEGPLEHFAAHVFHGSISPASLAVLRRSPGTAAATAE